MMFRHKLVVGALAGMLVVASAPPASADTATYDDPAGDVSDFDDAPVADPRADILSLTVRNERDLIEVEVQVAEAVDASDDAWTSDMGLVVFLEDPFAGAGGALWISSTPQGPAAFQQGFCDLDLTIDTVTDRYLMRVDDECVRAYPRSITPFAILSNGDHADYAPGEGFFSDEEPPEPVVSSSSAAVRRLAGTDRTLTAIELSADRFGEDEAGAVVLAAAMSFPDALAGGPLATYANAPILLSGADALDSRTAAEIRRVLEPGGRVYVLGGTAALSDKVVADVRAAGFNAHRVAGVNRFETAVRIAEEGWAVVRERFGIVDEPGSEIPFEVYVADGRTFTDALIAGAAAARMGGVLLLTDGSSMPRETVAYIDEHDAYTTAIGSAARTAWPPADDAIVGATPGQLSRRVVDELGLASGTVAIASEDTFADALAGAGNIGGFGPLLLTDGAALDQDVRVALEGSASALREVVIFGGTAAISSAVEAEIRSTLG